jgi:hypothetical protein
MTMTDGTFFTALYPRHPFVDFIAEDFPEDQQSFFVDPEVFADLVRRIRPQLVIEVGTWKGHSANAMADICKSEKLGTKIICVDTWLGSQEHYLAEQWRPTLHIEHGRPKIWERFIGNTLRRSNHDCIFPLALPAATASVVLSAMGVRASLIYIDAGHEYEDVSSDIRNYFPLLEENGIMFGDDFHHPPLAKAVRDFAASAGLGIARKGSKWVYLRDESLLNGLVGYEIVGMIGRSIVPSRLRLAIRRLLARESRAAA